jgi:hypothetical protein
MCECKEAPETVEHFLLKCELWDEERDALRRRVGPQDMRVESLLGNPDLIKETISFIEATSRLEF